MNSKYHVSATKAQFEFWIAQGFSQASLGLSLDLPSRKCPLFFSRNNFTLQSLQDGQRYTIFGGDPFLVFTAQEDDVQIDEQVSVHDSGRSLDGVYPERSRRARDDEGHRDDEIHEDGRSFFATKNPIQKLESLLSTFRLPKDPALPFPGCGAYGFFSYEARLYFENLPQHSQDDLNLPWIKLFFVDQLVVIDHQENKLWAVACGESYEKTYERLLSLKDHILKKLRRPAPSQGTSSSPGGLSAALEVREFGVCFHGFETSYDEYLEAIQIIKEKITSGHTYQANFSHRLNFKVTEDCNPYGIFQAVARKNPVPFASYLDCDDFQILSFSPERLLRLEDSTAITRPIAGTRRRKDAESDQIMIDELRTNSKERAEHIMLVDLARNDLAKFCHTVEVTKFMEIVPYHQIFHLESEVIGKKLPGISAVEALGHVFPGGTITGAPKINTMKILAQLEPKARGIYTGAIGYFAFDGNLDFSMAIRCFVHKDQNLTLSVGSGVTFEADPKNEYKETLNKARPLVESLGIKI